MPVVLAAEVESFALVPRGKDGSQRPHQFLHPRDRMIELDSITLLNLRANLRAQTQDEASFADQLEVIGLMGELNRIARECNRNIRHDVEILHRRCQHQRGEDVERSFEGEHA